MDKKILIISLMLGIILAVSCSRNSLSTNSDPSTDEYPEEIFTIQGNITQEWIDLTGFAPDSFVTIKIYKPQGEELSTEPFTIPIDSNGHGTCDGFQFLLDLKPGMKIEVSADTSDKMKELVLEDIAIIGFNVEQNTVVGTAPPQAALLIRIYDKTLNEGYEMEVTADSEGYWLADFGEEINVDLNENMTPQVLMLDSDQDATIAELTRSPYIEGNLPLDWIAASNFSPNDSVTFEVYESKNGALIGEPHIVDTDWNGVATLEGSQVGVDLQPDMYIVVRDNVEKEIEKGLLLVNLEIERPNFETSELQGFGPADTWLKFELYDHNDGGKYFMDVLSDGDGFWYLDFFDAFGVPFPSSDSTHIKLYDEDGDASVADPF